MSSAPPLIGPCCHGRNEAAVYKQLCDIVGEWIDILKSDDKPLPKPTPKGKFSGRFMVRVSPALHQRLALRALARGESLNSLASKALAKA